MAPSISDDDRPLLAAFWFLLFLGWAPLLSSYAYVLDPMSAQRDGLVTTFTERVTLLEQQSWGHHAIGCLGLAGLLATAILVKLKVQVLWPIPAFLLLSSFIYIFNAPGLGGPAEIAIHASYAVLAMTCTYLFLRHGHLLAPGFVGFVLLLFLDVAVGFWREGGLLGYLFVGHQPSLTNALLFLTVSVLVRMVWLLVRDNRQFVSSIGWETFRADSGKAFRLWYPMLVIFLLLGGLWWGVANLWLKPQALAEVENKEAVLRSDIQSWLIKNQLSPGDPGKFIATWADGGPTDGDPLEVALHRLNLLQIRFAERRFQKTISDTQKAGGEIEDFPDNLKETMETGYKESDLPLLDPPPWCFFLDPVCQVERSLKNSANDMMKSTRREVISKTHGTLTGPTAATASTIDEAAENARDALRPQVIATQNGSISSISAGFRTWRNISLLATLYSLIVLLKSAIIVFSRVIFAPKGDGGVAAQFLDDPLPGAPAMERHGQLLKIDCANPDAHFIARWGVTLEGPPPARRRPLGLGFPIARILSGTWVMNRIDGNRCDDPDEFDAELKVDEPAELVSWTLKPGERVIFHFSDFIGMSETLRVRRFTSLGITTLILGRMIYHAAEGPGVLILRTTAAARISNENGADRPAPMPKLVAWGSSSRFAIHAALTTIDTFFSGYNLRTSEDDGVIWDSSTKRGDGPGSGVLRFAKSFLLPI